jgi:ABC-type nitrate/sulfonate/bicarbonate transport system ATPase subunit
VTSSVPAAAIALRGLHHTFPGDPPVPVLRDLTLEVPSGAFASIVGPSGCGKSTLLRILAGLALAGGGEIEVLGSAAFMPQRDLLLPWRRAEDNAILGATLGGIPELDARLRARPLFETFGLSGFERAWPGQLSGGMRQRLALLRTFLTPRQTLLLDEPFGALDAITRRQMQEWLQSVWLADRRTVLLVTHDVDEALLLSDRVFVMSARPGTIVECLDVPLPRPRRTHDTTTPAFTALKARVLDALERGSAP